MWRGTVGSALLLSIVFGAALWADDATKKPPKNEPPAARAERPRTAEPGQLSPPSGEYGQYWWKTATPPPYSATGSPPRRLVYDLRSVPADDVAKEVNKFLKAESVQQPGQPKVVIVPEPITNRLLVSGPPEQLEKLGDVIKHLDAEPPLVMIDVLIVDVALGEDAPKDVEGQAARMAGKSLDAIAAEFEKLGKIRAMDRLSVTTLNNQPAFVKIGELKPRVVATNRSGPGGQFNSVKLEKVGLTLGVTPRVDADGLVTMEIDVDQSDLGSTEEGTPIAQSTEGETVRTPSVNSVKAQTTVAATSGQTIMLGGMINTSRTAGETPKTHVLTMFVVPHVIRATQEK